MSEVEVKRKVRKQNAKKKKKGWLFPLLLLLLVGILAFGGYQAYRFFMPQYIANEGLKKADEALKNKPEKPQVPDKVEYAKGYTYGKIRIPSINLEVALMEGLSPNKEDTFKDSTLLNYTVAHVNTTKHPGQKSQIFLAGHNDMQFHNLGQLQDKAEIFIDMPYGTFKYIVHAAPSESHKNEKVGMVVNENRGDAIQPDLSYEELVLQTCYPLNQYGNTNLRFLVYAYPEGQSPQVSLPAHAETDAATIEKQN